MANRKPTKRRRPRTKAPTLHTYSLLVSYFDQMQSARVEVEARNAAEACAKAIQSVDDGEITTTPVDIDGSPAFIEELERLDKGRAVEIPDIPTEHRAPADQDLRLIQDLWHFIENVTDEDPERHDKFFALRERVRTCRQTE